jgi:hypothetical protein
LKDAYINSNLDIVTNSHEASTIFLSYNNMVPWLSYVTIFLYFEWFEYWCEDLYGSYVYSGMKILDLIFVTKMFELEILKFELLDL